MMCASKRFGDSRLARRSSKSVQLKALVGISHKSRKVSNNAQPCVVLYCYLQYYFVMLHFIMHYHCRFGFHAKFSRDACNITRDSNCKKTVMETLLFACS